MDDYCPELYCPTATIEINKMDDKTLDFFYYVIVEQYRDVFIREIEFEGERTRRFYVTPELVENSNLKDAYKLLAYRADEIETMLKDFLAGEYEDWREDWEQDIRR